MIFLLKMFSIKTPLKLIINVLNSISIGKPLNLLQNTKKLKLLLLLALVQFGLSLEVGPSGLL